MSKINIKREKLFLRKFIFLMGIYLLAGLYSQTSQAQNSYRNLILSNQHTEHYISPYLTRFTKNNNIQTIDDITSNPFLQGEVLSASGSIVLLQLNEKTSWLAFDVINRSGQEKWDIDFGSSFDGRFGIFKKIQAYTINGETNAVEKFPLHQNKNIKLHLPADIKSKVIIQFEKADNLPITVPLTLINANNTADVKPPFDEVFWISMILLIGMAFFFVAIALSKFNNSYLFFSAYYICLSILMFTQNNWIMTESMLVPNIQTFLIFLIATISLIIATFFWYPEDKAFWTKPIFFIPVSLSVISIIASHFMTMGSNPVGFFLSISPSILIILLIPLFCIMQGEEKNETTTPFMLGWFILLFGICISTLALSGILQPVSSAINAYWYALIPQAIFFIITARINITPGNENITLSKVLEINESASISKLRQAKENTEQERLLKVIEQERKVLGELRKSEVRRTEKMRKAKELADEANKGKSAFLAVVSHEIRTPMTGIMGMVRMLLNSNLTKEQNEYAQTIQDSSDAMLALLNDILDFEKIEQGKMTFENISFDLHRLIQGVGTLMQGHAVQKGIKLQSKMGESLPQFVMGDPTRLRQVLLNLTGNAVKFTQEGGVTITAELMKENKENNTYEIYFSVTDNGIGISEEAKKDLFTPFSQADKSISRKFGGTGLGLAISKGLVANMGSDINISSSEGEGSTFFFTLSMEGGHGDSQAEQEKREKSYAPIDKQKILLIDDNHINRKVVHGLLSELPYDIDDADNAEDGLKIIENEQFDLILMDIELPGMNGDEAAKKIRNHMVDKIRHIPIIALTGNTQDEHISHYYNCGINSFISKPIDPAGLIKTIENSARGIFTNKNMTAPSPEQSGSHTDTENKSTPSDNKTVPTENLAPALAPEIKNISEPTVKKIAPVIGDTNSTIHNKKNHVKEEVKIKAQDLDTETLESLKKHLDVDKIIEMLNDVFVKTDEMIADLKQAIDTNDMETVQAKCHDLKGMTGNFGLTALSELARDIEQKAKSQPSIIITSLVDDLIDTKKRAEKALSEWSSSQDDLII